MFTCTVETWKRRTYPKDANGKQKLVMVRCIGYEQHEADRDGLKYGSLVELVRGPAWFLTDDKYVIRCHKVDVPKNKVYCYKFFTDMGVISYNPQKPPNKTSFTVFKNTGYRPLSNAPTRVNYRGARGRMFAKAYVAFVISGQKVDWAFLGRLVFPKDRNLAARGKKTLNFWEIRKMIDDETGKQLEKLGITLKGAVDKMEEGYAVAKAKKDAQSMIRVAENYLDLFNKKAPTQDIPQLDGPGVLQTLEAAERQLAGLPEVTTDDRLKAALTQYEEVSQEELLAEANKLLIKPEIK